METRVFDLEVEFGNAGNSVGVLVLRPPAGTGEPRSFDDLRAMGWNPIHWSTLPSKMTAVAKYRVVMERAARERAGGIPLGR
jgi:hypothetical protein